MDFIKEYVSVAQGASGDWTKALKLDDILDEKTPRTYAKESESIHNVLTRELDHVKHQLNVKVEQMTEQGKPVNTASFRVDYLHTLEGYLHFVYVNASTSMNKILKPIFVSHKNTLKHLFSFYQIFLIEYFVTI